MIQPVPQSFPTPSARKAAQKRRANWKMLFTFILVVGGFLLWNFNDRFVFHHAEAYMKITIWALILLTPLLLYWMVRSPAVAADLAKNHPATSLRNIVIMPLAAAFMVGLVFAAPLGWLFATAAWSGGAIHQVNATAIKVGTYYKRKNCDQLATLRFTSVDKETCLDGLYPPSLMREGQLLSVGTTTFPFGFLIVSIARADLTVSTVRQGSMTNHP